MPSQAPLVSEPQFSLLATGPALGTGSCAECEMNDPYRRLSVWMVGSDCLTDVAIKTMQIPGPTICVENFLGICISRLQNRKRENNTPGYLSALLPLKG